MYFHFTISVFLIFAHSPELKHGLLQRLKKAAWIVIVARCLLIRFRDQSEVLLLFCNISTKLKSTAYFHSPMSPTPTQILPSRQGPRVSRAGSSPPHFSFFRALPTPVQPVL
ncbi:hypothetical protein ILYODFUR_012987 [Ilyodon furcidens]|uniref:Secreted protein n=1 Tax=Ilyodon furcidens TaxID=33524 RepID=A0ABV0U506_9TELE